MEKSHRANTLKLPQGKKFRTIMGRLGGEIFVPPPGSLLVATLVETKQLTKQAPNINTNLQNPTLQFKTVITLQNKQKNLDISLCSLQSNAQRATFVLLLLYCSYCKAVLQTSVP